MVDLFKRRIHGSFFFPLLSAILFALTYPDFSLWPLSFAALVPLFYQINKTDTLKGCLKLSILWSIFFHTALGFFLKNAVIDHYGYSWPAFFLFFLFGLILPHAVIFFLFCTASVFLRPDNRDGGPAFIFNVLAVPSLWILHEYAKEIIPFAIPWGSLGCSTAGFSAYMQSADIGGVYFVSFLTASMNSSFAMIVRDFTVEQMQLRKTALNVIRSRYFVFPVLIFLLNISYGYYRIQEIDSIISRMTAEKRSVAAVAVQAGHTNRQRWDETSRGMVLADYVALSGFDKSIPSITVWPETIINSPGDINDNVFPALMSLLNENSFLAAGGVRKNPAGGIHNSAYFISGDKTLRWYDKIILLPFSETTSFGAGFGSFYNAPSEFSPGRRGQAVKTPQGTAGAGICFEAVYPSHAREAVLSGAEFLINLSNDSWFGDIAQPMTHLVTASVRCIENRRYMVRASNSGHSAVIDPAGRFRMTPLNEKTSIRGEIIPMKDLTVYSRYGGWIIIFALCAAASFGISGMFSSRK